MIRFRVIRGAKLLVSVAAVVLAFVVLLLAIRISNAREAQDTAVSANYVRTVQETETAFAVSASVVQPDDFVLIEVLPLAENADMPATPNAVDHAKQRSPSPLFSDTDNEHTDPVVSETPLPQTAGMSLFKGRPVRVLIYHTHTHEAYEQTPEDPYKAIEAWRTTDNGHSVVRVGKELARLLTERGFDVTHDTTDFEAADHTTAYTRSLAGLTAYAEPFDLYIDLHRDGYVEGMELAVEHNGVRYARLMMLIGNGEGFEEKPFFSENHALAQRLTDRLNTLLPGIGRSVMVKNGRYNQHIGIHSILVEAGSNKNTLQEALNAMIPLADAIETVFYLEGKV